MNDGTTGYGRVDSIFNISKFETTNAQYTEFLNAKDPTGVNVLGLSTRGTNPIIANLGIAFNPNSPDGSKYAVISGRENLPVNSVTWYRAIRFANWLNNGQGNGDTETGAYTLLDGTQIPSNGDSIVRNPGATVFLPSEDEWYKAAYFNPKTNSYFLYPTSSNAPPNAELPPGGINSANWKLVAPLPLMTNVGAYVMSSSPYGTLDQAGNVWELNETLITDDRRGLRGGSYSLDPSALPNDLISTYRNQVPPSEEIGNVGFRVAEVPEPPSSLLIVVAGVVFCWAQIDLRVAVYRNTFREPHMIVATLCDGSHHRKSTLPRTAYWTCVTILLVSVTTTFGYGPYRVTEIPGTSANAINSYGQVTGWTNLGQQLARLTLQVGVRILVHARFNPRIFLNLHLSATCPGNPQC